MEGLDDYLTYYELPGFILSLDYCCSAWGGRYIYHDNIL